MSSIANEGYGLVIKTSEYTGNFEREICAFLTGCVGECEVGKHFVNVLTEGRPDFANVMNVADDHGCYRPVSLHENNSNDLVIFFEDAPSKEQINWIKENASKFNEARKKDIHMGEFYQNSNIKILGFELEKYERNVKSRTL
jgi:hypothetical protein